MLCNMQYIMLCNILCYVIYMKYYIIYDTFDILYNTCDI